MNDALDRYRRAGHRHVEGWLTDTAIAVIVQMSDIQRARGIGGPVCEIGVHHGRLFILLHLMTRGDERSVAWDLFERQAENLDKSGEGNRVKLAGNLRRHGCDLSRISIITENSLNLAPDVIIRECRGRPRLFSVDGGHTADTTFNDLSLAAESVADDGLVVLDDYFNESWPGVAEGTCRYMESATGSLHPALIAGNKFFFARAESAARMYRTAFAPMRGSHGQRLSRVFGGDVLVVVPYRSTLKRRLMNSALLRPLAAAVQFARQSTGKAAP